MRHLRYAPLGLLALLALMAALVLGDARPVGADDGDGVPSPPDNCASIYNPGQEDADGDGRGDACDTSESDGDSVVDRVEAALGSDASDPTSTPEHFLLPLTCGDGIDNDGDGFSDLADPPVAGYGNTFITNGGCSGDSDGDGINDLTEIDALSRPYAQAGTASQPEDVSVPGTCADGVDNDGDGGADLGVFPFIPLDTGCLDGDGDGHSDARETAFGSNPNDDSSTPENLQVKPTSTHVCLDGIDNDGDGLTDVGTAITTGDDTCRIMLRIDMNKSITNAFGTEITTAIEQCRVDFHDVGGPENTARIHFRIENSTPLFGFGEADLLYDQTDLIVITGASGASAAAVGAGIVDFWTKNGGSNVFAGSEAVPDSDGRYERVFVADQDLTGPTGNGAVAELELQTRIAAGQPQGSSTVISIDPSAYILRSNIRGFLDDGGGLPRHNPNSLVGGTIYFDNDLAFAGSPCPSDSDSDGVDNRVDNCVSTFNPDQGDNDFDGAGDVCASDDDNDGVLDLDELSFGSDPFNPSGTPENTEFDNTACSDGVDNDRDGLTDGADPDCVLVLTVEIDVKPGSDPNSTNLGSGGVIPVAVLTTPDFDAATVDPATVVFARPDGGAPVHDALKDVDEDGDLDLIMHFRTRDAGIPDDAIEACLTGETTGGETIEGCDTIRIVPPWLDSDGDSLGLGDAFGLFFGDAVEATMGTDQFGACSTSPSHDAWPPDFDRSQDVDGSDLFLFAERFGTELGVPPPVGKLAYIPRFDIYPTAASFHKIDGSDLFVLASYFGNSCP